MPFFIFPSSLKKLKGVFFLFSAATQLPFLFSLGREHVGRDPPVVKRAQKDNSPASLSSLLGFLFSTSIDG